MDTILSVNCCNDQILSDMSIVNCVTNLKTDTHSIAEVSHTESHRDHPLVQSPVREQSLAGHNDVSTGGESTPD